MALRLTTNSLNNLVAGDESLHSIKWIIIIQNWSRLFWTFGWTKAYLSFLTIWPCVDVTLVSKGDMDTFYGELCVGRETIPTNKEHHPPNIVVTEKSFNLPIKEIRVGGTPFRIQLFA